MDFNFNNIGSNFIIIINVIIIKNVSIIINNNFMLIIIILYLVIKIKIEDYTLNQVINFLHH